MVAVKPHPTTYNPTFTITPVAVAPTPPPSPPPCAHTHTFASPEERMLQSRVSPFVLEKAWRHRLESSVLRKERSQTQNLLKFSNTTLSSISTFTETQLQRDYRTRLSTALFEAGLLNTNYARNLLAQVPLIRPTPSLLQVSPFEPPPRPSRRQLAPAAKSDIFFTNPEV
ncbi:unnamed protein product [Hydatigera taeniaeformis]|uniref:Uncharacterized protein n=1 Tax=Hydatigena taeniaeformis TaxID=6205 RepID=A0A0R3X9G0_HYDTA|nr:unnamed protein product [Hydatigera taeniaeformis]